MSIADVQLEKLTVNSSGLKSQMTGAARLDFGQQWRLRTTPMGCQQPPMMTTVAACQGKHLRSAAILVVLFYVFYLSYRMINYMLAVPT